MHEEITVTWPEAGKVAVSDSCQTNITYLGVCVPDGKAVVVELNPEQVESLIQLLNERMDQHFADSGAFIPCDTEELELEAELQKRERHLRLV